MNKDIEKLTEKMIRQGFPKGFLRTQTLYSVFENIPDTKESVLRWWEKLTGVDKPWIYLWGEVGEWKTACAVQLARELLLYKIPPHISGSYTMYYRSCLDLFNWLRDFRSSNTFSQVGWDNMLKSGLFVLDDLGTEAESVYIFQMMEQLFNYRYENGPLITIITSNYSPESIVDRIIGFGEKQKARTGVDDLDEFAVIAQRITRRIMNQSIVVEV